MQRLFPASLRRAMSTHISRVIITDPCYVKGPEEYKAMIEEGLLGTPSSRQPGMYVQVPVSRSFFTDLAKRKTHEAFSKSNYESFWSLGKPVDDLSKLVYLGSHGSDSGLTSLVQADPFSNPEIQPVDWTEFTLSTLDSKEGDVDALEEYGLYAFFGGIPDEASEAAVFGLPSVFEPEAYDSIVIRSIDAAPLE